MACSQLLLAVWLSPPHLPAGGVRSSIELAGLGQSRMQQQPSNGVSSNGMVGDGVMPNGVKSNNTGQTAVGVHDNLQRQDSSSSDDAEETVAGGASDWDP